MPNLNLSINYRRPLALPLKTGIEKGRELGQWLSRVIDGLSSGNLEADHAQLCIADDVALGDNAYGQPAHAMLVGSSLSGSVGGTIAGTAVTVTASGGDTATQTALVAAILANTSVNRIVAASNRAAQVTLASVAAGDRINIFGCNFVAVATSAAVLVPGDFNIDGTDTQDATALALAINRHPVLAGRVVAISSAAVVFIFLIEDRAPNERECITNPPTTITVNVAKPTAGARTAVVCLTPGLVGNEVRLAASGTGMTAVTAGTAGQLGNGKGGGTAANTFRVVP